MTVGIKHFYVVAAVLGLTALSASLLRASESPSNIVFPRDHWETRLPADLGMDAAKLDHLAKLLAGRGCVVKDGYVVASWGDQKRKRDWASSAKPVLSTLLLFAIQEGTIPNVDAKIADLGWPLSSKDQSMTFAHLANMTSGYARQEPPGAAWAYNDFAIQLYQKSLFDKVFRADPDKTAADRFAPLQLEDGLTFDPNRRRLKASVRDFARLGWFWLQRGNWEGREVLSRKLVEQYQRPHVPPDLPLSGKEEVGDYLRIGSYGGGSSHFSKSGPGAYGYNWWFNGRGKPQGDRLSWPDAPTDAFMSIGAGGNCSVMIPSLRLVLVAAEANWGESTPGDRQSPMNRILALLVDAANSKSAPKPSVAPTGELKKWHRATLTFEGPDAGEAADPNPFRDYRLSVAFTRRMRTITVPGYFAADGDAADSGADKGNKWRVNFLPDEEGEWSWHASFVRGPDVAVDADPNAGEPTAFDGASGSFVVSPNDKRIPDSRARGLLRDVGERYFVFQQTNEPYIKGGADSPENFLAYVDFDATTATHRYLPHAGDFREGDPTWRGGKGKNIFGSLNYLASKGVNCLYFLTMNVKGDGKDVWPWTSKDERFRFDCSKLDQWEIVLSHMDRLGILLHVVHQEQENDQLLDRGELGPQRKLYYRELIARFAHHPALEWNLGEENTNTTAQLKNFAKYIHTLDPWRHPIVVHTFPSQYDKVYEPLLGDKYIAGASLQVGKPERCAKITATWIEKSRKSGRPWAVFLDEIGPADTGVKPDADDPDHDAVRKDALWAPLLAGGSGAEWLFGYKYAHHDVNCEDFRSRDRMWDQTRFAVQFFQTHVPVRKTRPADDLIVAGKAQCLALVGAEYALYLPEGGSATLRLDPGSYDVGWYNPRQGGSLQSGSVQVVEGAGDRPIGNSPSEPAKDWAVLVRKR